MLSKRGWVLLVRAFGGAMVRGNLVLVYLSRAPLLHKTHRNLCWITSTASRRIPFWRHLGVIIASVCPFPAHGCLLFDSCLRYRRGCPVCALVAPCWPHLGLVLVWKTAVASMVGLVESSTMATLASLLNSYLHYEVVLSSIHEESY